MPIRLTRLRKRLLFVLLCLPLLYVAGGFLLTPSLIRWFVLPAVNEQLNGELTIESIATNPLRLSGTLEGLKVVDAQGETALSADLIYGNLQIRSLFEQRWNVYRVELVKPEIFAVLDASGDVNLLGLVKPSESEADTPLTVPPASIGSLSIQEAGLHFRDERFDEPFEQAITPISLTVEGFDTQPDNDNPYTIRAQAASGESVVWEGTLRLDPLSSQGRLSLEGFQPEFYAPFYQRQIPFEVREGVVSFSTQYTFAPLNDPPEMRAENLEVTVRDLAVHEPGEERPFFSLESVAVSGAEADLYGALAGAESVVVHGGGMRIERAKDGTVNLLALAESFLPAGERTQGTTFSMSALPEERLLDPSGDVTAELDEFDLRRPVNVALEQLEQLATLEWLAYLDRIEIREHRIDVVDRLPSTPAEIEMELESFVATGLANAPGTEITFDLKYRIDEEGSLVSSGRLLPLERTVDYAYSASNIPLTLADPYVGTLLNAALVQGTVEASGDLSVRPAEPLPEVQAKNTVRVHNFAVKETLNDAPLLSFNLLRIDEAAVTSEPPEARLTLVELDGLNGQFQRLEDGSLLVTKLPKFTAADFSEETDPDSASSVSQSEGLQIITHALLDLFQQWESLDAPAHVTVDAFVLTDAAFLLEDLSMPPARVAVSDLNAKVENLTTVRPQKASFDVSGVLNEEARFTLVGQVSPLKQDRFTELEATLESFDLTPFTAYAGQFVGFELVQGALTTKLDYRLNQSLLEGDNRIEVDQLRFGEATDSPDAVDLPVKLAVALLKDSSGRIVLDVPIRGDLSDPTFSLGPVIAQAFRTIIANIVTSPFKFLGGLVGGGEEFETLKEVIFPAGSAKLEDRPLKKLRVIEKALMQRPGLTLVILPQVNPALDAEGMKLAQLRAGFVEDKRRALQAEGKSTERVELSRREYRRAVENAYRAAFLQPQTTTDVTAPKVDPVPSNAVEEPTATESASAPNADTPASTESAITPPREADATAVAAPSEPERAPLRIRRAGPRFSPGIARRTRTPPATPSESSAANAEPAPASSAATTSAAADAQSEPTPVPVETVDAVDEAPATETTPTPGPAGAAPPAPPPDPNAPLPELAAMEAALVEAIEIPEDALRALAQARAQAVADHLTGEGEVPAERIVIRPPDSAKTLPTEGKARVEFSLE
ncbi:MAG: DUF748 domain-containing protein [Opitutales bacterium]